MGALASGSARPDDDWPCRPIIAHLQLSKSPLLDLTDGKLNDSVGGLACRGQKGLVTSLCCGSREPILYWGICLDITEAM
jgi:hypothetical protein